jgi:exopolysaccharide biosynthesis protein|tara:strand:- start:1987 stop:2826 length:840 start_codon:yes stop_codon:yes gene_type:complete
MKWKIISDLPNNIILYQGYDQQIPIRAWTVVVPNKKKNKVKVLVSNDSDGLDTPGNFAKSTNALVVINGGYFSSGQHPTHHIGLLKSDNILHEPASSTVIRDNIRYNVTRGALGILNNGDIDIGWASTKGDSILVWNKPINNRPGKPGISDFGNAKFWDVIDAMHAGPILISDGKINITSEEEVFFNTPVDGVQPRSAIGYRLNGDIVIIVVDGRQVDSRGVYLEELAILMSQFNCHEALNLDGGGSSALIIDKKLINRPIGLNTQREVMSSIAIFSEN